MGKIEGAVGALGILAGWLGPTLLVAVLAASGRDAALPWLVVDEHGRETAILVFELLANEGDGHRMELAAAESSIARAELMYSCA
jgi:hypothetical protein